VLSRHFQFTCDFRRYVIVVIVVIIDKVILRKTENCTLNPYSPPISFPHPSSQLEGVQCASAPLAGPGVSAKCSGAFSAQNDASIDSIFIEFLGNFQTFFVLAPCCHNSFWIRTAHFAFRTAHCVLNDTLG